MNSRERQYLVFAFAAAHVRVLSEGAARSDGARLADDSGHAPSVPELSVRLSPLTAHNGTGWAAVDVTALAPERWMLTPAIVSLLACDPDPEHRRLLHDGLEDCARGRLLPVGNPDKWLNRITHDPEAARKLHERTATFFAAARGQSPLPDDRCLLLDADCGIRQLSAEEIRRTDAFRRRRAGLTDCWSPRRSFSLARACDWIARAEAFSPPFGSKVIAGLAACGLFPPPVLLAALRDQAADIAAAVNLFRNPKRSLPPHARPEP